VMRVLEVKLPCPRERTDGNFAVFRKELFEEFHLVHQQAHEASEYVI